MQYLFPFSVYATGPHASIHNNSFEAYVIIGSIFCQTLVVGMLYFLHSSLFIRVFHISCLIPGQGCCSLKYSITTFHDLWPSTLCVFYINSLLSMFVIAAPATYLLNASATPISTPALCTMVISNSSRFIHNCTARRDSSESFHLPTKGL
jgi:hypothetical protein